MKIIILTVLALFGAAHAGILPGDARYNTDYHHHHHHAFRQYGPPAPPQQPQPSNPIPAQVYGAPGGQLPASQPIPAKVYGAPNGVNVPAASQPAPSVTYGGPVQPQQQPSADTEIVDVKHVELPLPHKTYGAPFKPTVPALSVNYGAASSNNYQVSNQYLAPVSSTLAPKTSYEVPLNPSSNNYVESSASSSVSSSASLTSYLPPEQQQPSQNREVISLPVQPAKPFREYGAPQPAPVRPQVQPAPRPQIQLAPRPQIQPAPRPQVQPAPAPAQNVFTAYGPPTEQPRPAPGHNVHTVYGPPQYQPVQYQRNTYPKVQYEQPRPSIPAVPVTQAPVVVISTQQPRQSVFRPIAQSSAVSAVTSRPAQTYGAPSYQVQASNNNNYNQYQQASNVNVAVAQPQQPEFEGPIASVEVNQIHSVDDHHHHHHDVHASSSQQYDQQGGYVY